MELLKQEQELVRQIEGLKADIEAIQQPRSDFALIHFVVGMHDKPGRQRMQAVLELQIKMFNIRRAQLDEQELNIKRRVQEKITNTNGDENDKALAKIEMERIDVNLAELNLARLGAIREAECLLSILDQLPQYTYEQLQAEEAEYWQARLSRQAGQDLRAMGAVTPGNIEAINQMLREPGESTPAFDAAELGALAQLPTLQ